MICDPEYSESKEQVTCDKKKMRAVSFLLIGVALAVPAIYGFPAKSNDDAEVIDVVPLVRQRPTFHDVGFGDDFDGIIDTGSFEPEDAGFGTPYNPFQFDFSGLLHSLDDYMRRMRDRFANVWTRVPYPDTDTDGGLGFVGSNDKGNTTSKVEIIDGHKVIVNDTVYTRNTDFGTSIVKVRTVEVVPNTDETTESESTTSAPVKPQLPTQKPAPTRPSTTPRDVEQDSDEITNASTNKLNEIDNEIEVNDATSTTTDPETK